MEEIQAQIKEKQILNLTHKILRLEYAYLHNLTDSTFKQTKDKRQGLLFSSLFVNLFFHKIDTWVENALLPYYNISQINKIIPKQNHQVLGVFNIE